MRLNNVRANALVWIRMPGTLYDNRPGLLIREASARNPAVVLDLSANGQTCLVPQGRVDRMTQSQARETARRYPGPIASVHTVRPSPPPRVPLPPPTEA